MLRYIERIGEPARQFKEEVDRMLQWEGVVSKGMVGQQELTAALRSLPLSSPSSSSLAACICALLAAR
eukprot:3117250-Rhodomonas_salina.1